VLDAFTNRQSLFIEGGEAMNKGTAPASPQTLRRGKGCQAVLIPVMVT
jgi:hypothetical protein